jgi:hypothetical protein
MNHTTFPFSLTPFFGFVTSFSFTINNQNIWFLPIFLQGETGHSLPVIEDATVFFNPFLGFVSSDEIQT